MAAKRQLVMKSVNLYLTGGQGRSCPKDRRVLGASTKQHIRSNVGSLCCNQHAL